MHALSCSLSLRCVLITVSFVRGFDDTAFHVLETNTILFVFVGKTDVVKHVTLTIKNRVLSKTVVFVYTSDYSTLFFKDLKNSNQVLNSDI